MCRSSVRSVSSGVFELSVRPRRLLTLNTWVSTAMAALFQTTASITLAVLRPTPGSLIRLSMSEGSSPPKSSSIIRAALMMARVLLLGKVTLLMYSYTSSSPAAASDAGSGKRSKSAGVTMLMRLSVHCAERITAKSRWNGLS